MIEPKLKRIRRKVRKVWRDTVTGRFIPAWLARLLPKANTVEEEVEK